MILSRKFWWTLLVLFSYPFLVDSVDGSQDFDDDNDDSLNSSKTKFFSFNYSKSDFEL